MVGAPSLVRDVEAEEEPRPKKTAQHSGRLLVRMPATLHDELAQAAEAEGVSLNQFITGVLAGAVEWGPEEDGTGSRGARSRKASGGVTRLALAVNLAVVLIAAVAAVTLLVVAWQQGW